MMLFFDDLTFDNNLVVRFVVFDIVKSYLSDFIEYVINKNDNLDELILSLENKNKFNFYCGHHKYIIVSCNSITIQDSLDGKICGTIIENIDRNKILNDIKEAAYLRSNLILKHTRPTYQSLEFTIPDNSELIYDLYKRTSLEIDIKYGWRNGFFVALPMNYYSMLISDFFNSFCENFFFNKVNFYFDRALTIYELATKNTNTIVNINSAFRLIHYNQKDIIFKNMIDNISSYSNSMYISQIYDSIYFKHELDRLNIIFSIGILVKQSKPNDFL